MRTAPVLHMVVGVLVASATHACVRCTVDVDANGHRRVLAFIHPTYKFSRGCIKDMTPMCYSGIFTAPGDVARVFRARHHGTWLGSSYPRTLQEILAVIQSLSQWRTEHSRLCGATPTTRFLLDESVQDGVDGRIETPCCSRRASTGVAHRS